MLGPTVILIFAWLMRLELKEDLQFLAVKIFLVLLYSFRLTLRDSIALLGMGNHGTYGVVIDHLI